MKYRTLLHVEADTVDQAAQLIADLLAKADADPHVFTDIVTEDHTSPVLHFATRT